MTWIVWVATALWTLGCGIGGYRLIQLKRSGEWQTEHWFNAFALLFLLAAPYINLLVYTLTEGSVAWAGAGQIFGAAIMYALGRRVRTERLDPNARNLSSVSFREKSATLMFSALCLLTLVAASIILGFGMDVAIPVIIASVVLLIILSIAGHIIIAVTHYPLTETDAPEDERDREIGLSGIRNAHYVLMSALWIVPVIAVVDVPGFIIAVVSFALITLSELVYYGSLVRYYKFGAT